MKTENLSRMRRRSLATRADFRPYIVELKAANSLVDEHRAQVVNFLKATKKKLGLLVNFGHHAKLEHERLVN